MVLDVPANAKIYDETMLQISQQYVRELPQAQAQSVIICPIYGLSTKAESQDVSQCLKTLGVHTVLVVTSDYHTRRALSTFRHELPGMQISVAAASDPQQFGGAWWKHRQWAKLNFDEWLRLVWWHAVDRWR
jgi:vancomycin permeability regulator SanA